MEEERANPFPSGGITRPGVKQSVYVPLVSQMGVIERIEGLIRSVAKHPTKIRKDDEGFKLLLGKPELVMVVGDYGYGKTFTLTALYFELKERKIKIKEDNLERTLISIPIYQPVHAFVTQPPKLLDILTEKLISEAPKEIQKDLKKAKEESERRIEEKDPLLKKINIWKYTANEAIRKGVDVIVIMLDELEESIEDYGKFKEEYADLFSMLREFTDRQLGPVITILGITQEAIESIVEETKEALLRRTLRFDLPHLTSPSELLRLAKAYDPKVEEYLDKDALNTVYSISRGNPGVALAILHWAWEEMASRGLHKISKEIAEEAAERVAWKGRKMIGTVSSEVEFRYPETRRLLEEIKQKIEPEITPASVIKGLMLSLDSIAWIKDSGKLIEKFAREIEELDFPKEYGIINLNFYSEPKVTYSCLLMYDDSAYVDERKIKRLLESWKKVNGDFITFIVPIDAIELSRTFTRICENEIYRGIPIIETVILLRLSSEDMKFISVLDKIRDVTPAEMKNIEKMICEKYGIQRKIEEKLRKLREAGKTIPYRWEVTGLTKEAQWMMYKLLCEEFSEKEFSRDDARQFILSRYEELDELKSFYEKIPWSKVRERIWNHVSAVLESMVDQGFAVRIADKYTIPPLINYEKEVYNVIKNFRDKEGRNPGTEDIKTEFFGTVPKGNNIYAVALGMEGKGYLKCVMEGPRRFYIPLDPKERIVDIEMKLSRLEMMLQNILIQKLPIDNVAKINKFAKQIIKEKENVTEKIRKDLNNSNKETDVLEKLRVLSYATRSLEEIYKYADKKAEEWLRFKQTIQSSKSDIERILKIIENSVKQKKLNEQKAIYFKGLVSKLEVLIENAGKKLSDFDLKSVKEILHKVEIQFQQIQTELAEDLKEIAKIQRMILVAEENIDEIEKFLNENAKWARELELFDYLNLYKQELERVKKIIEKGDTTVEIDIPRLPVFIESILSKKLEEVNIRKNTFETAKRILLTLSQPEGHEIARTLHKIESLIKRVEKARNAGRVETYLKYVSEIWEIIKKQESCLEKLKNLFMGALRDRQKYEKLDIDRVVARSLAVDVKTARSLRHLLESIEYVKCKEVEVIP